MSRSKNSLDDYRELGNDLGLKLLVDEITGDSKTKVQWQCTNCGRVHLRHYNDLLNVRYQRDEKGLPMNVCRCRASNALTREKFKQVADDLGIEWLVKDDEFIPQQSTDKTKWRGVDGEIFYASYRELAYNKIPMHLRRHVENTLRVG